MTVNSWISRRAVLGPKIWTQCPSEHSACLYSLFSNQCPVLSLRNAPAGSQQVFLFNVANLQLDVCVRYISCQLLLLTCDIRLFSKRCPHQATRGGSEDGRLFTQGIPASNEENSSPFWLNWKSKFHLCDQHWTILCWVNQAFERN